MSDSRRLRNYAISSSDLVHAFVGIHSEFHYVARATIEGIPPDAVVEHVFCDQSNRRLLATVSHDSFEVVPGGTEIPVFAPSYDTTYEVLRRTEIDGEECYQFRSPISPSDEWRDKSIRHLGVKVERLHPQDGDVIVVELPDGISATDMNYVDKCKDILSVLDTKNVHFVLLPHGCDMRHASEAELAYIRKAVSNETESVDCKSGEEHRHVDREPGNDQSGS